MNVVPFPSPVLTDEDEKAVAAKLRSGDGYYGLRRGTDQRGRPCFMLLNREGDIRGYVVKIRGFYCVLDARGTAVVECRNRDQALTALAK